MENITQNWENRSEPIWASVDSSTITNAQIDVEDVEDSSDRYNYIPFQTHGVTALVSCEIGGERSEFERKCQIKKYFWHPKHLIGYLNSFRNNVILLEGSDDYQGFSGDAVATMFKWPDFWGQIEYQEVNQRGVYSPKYERNILFSKTLMFKTSDLPLWKPTTIIGKRNFEVDDAQ